MSEGSLEAPGDHKAFCHSWPSPPIINVNSAQEEMNQFKKMSVGTDTHAKQEQVQFFEKTWLHVYTTPVQDRKKDFK